MDIQITTSFMTIIMYVVLLKRQIAYRDDFEKRIKKLEEKTNQQSGQ